MRPFEDLRAGSEEKQSGVNRSCFSLSLCFVTNKVEKSNFYKDLEGVLDWGESFKICKKSVRLSASLRGPQGRERRKTEWSEPLSLFTLTLFCDLGSREI